MALNEQSDVIARLYETKTAETDTDPLAAGNPTGNKDYWRTIAVPLEAHIAAARQGLSIPHVMQGAREFFHTHADMREKLAKPAPARSKFLSQLATPKGGQSALEQMRSRAIARQKEFEAGGMTSPRLPQPPPGSGRKRPISALAPHSAGRAVKPSPRQRLRSIKGSMSERERRQGPREFGVDSYVGQSAVKSLRTQALERKIKVVSGSDSDNVASEAIRSAEELARRLNEHDAATAEAAVARKAKLQEVHDDAQFESQLAAAKRQLHSDRLMVEHTAACDAAKEVKHTLQREAAAKRYDLC